ncbi:MAG: RidA family protein [Chthonomonadaceae bacterium]|nr:RidA family protein [Chthonomonadaceae bacterium]
MIESQTHYPMAEGQTRHAPPLSMVRRLGNTLYVSGHGAVNDKGEFVSPDFEEQMRYTMEQLKATLEGEGVSTSEVVMVRGYAQNPANLPLYNQLYRDYFSEPFPARTTIVGCLPPGLEFEIDCVAEVNSR